MGETCFALNWFLILIKGCKKHKLTSSSNLHDAGYLLHLTLSWEERIARVEFSQNAAQTPHINGHAVVVTQDNFWRAVEAALDVGVH